MFNNKNVYIIPESDHFFFLHIDALVTRGGIDPTDFCAVFISNDNERVIDGYPGVEYFNSNLVDFDDLKHAKTITSLSLSNHNATFIRELIDSSPEVIDKYYIYLTDDEVDRWESVYHDNGELIEDRSKELSADVMSVLSRVHVFVGPEAALKHRIEKVLQRTVSFIDAVCFFYILPFEEHRKVVDNVMYSDNEIKRVWYHTKTIKRGFSGIRDFISLYHSFSRAFSNKVHFIVFSSHPKTSFYLYFCLLYLRYIKKMKVSVDIVSHTDKYSYINQLQACDFLVLQPRGGATTARTLISMKRGMVCVLDNTMNKDGLENSYKMPLIYGKDYQAIAHKAANNLFDIQSSYDKMHQAEQNSIDVLKRLYRV